MIALKPYYIDFFDVCFVQEHWLLSSHLHKIGEISKDFAYVGVCGMDDSFLLAGRPFGGCAILYRNSLSSCVTPLHSHSNRFCAVKLCDLSGSSVLLISVYMPSDNTPVNYLNTLLLVTRFWLQLSHH